MDEYQHHERLTTDANFEEGQYINGEFFYKKRKAARQQTEEDRLYGVFQGSSSDEDGYNAGLGKKKKKKRGDDSAALHKEVAFVSSGTVAGTTDEKFAVSDKVGDMAGGRLDGQHVGLGAATEKKEAEEEEDAPVADTGLARMVHKSAQEKRNKTAKEKETTRQRQKVLKADPELAKFENHSKGIGSKLLKLMGWKPGEGLGRAKEGIAKPLEAAMRPKGAGLGAAGEEPSLAPKAEAAAAADAKKKEAEQPQSALKTAWKARNRSKAASANVVKSADELVAEQEVAGGVLGAGAAPAMTILDFTGPQTRVVSNMEDLQGKQEKEESEVPFPELQHNLKLLVDIAEGDIRRLDGKVRLEHEKAEMLQQQAQELDSEADRLDKELERATQVLSMLSIVDDRMKEQLVDSDELLAIYEQVKESFPEEYVMFDCPAIAVYQLLPSMVPDLAAWDILQAPLQWLPSFSAWKRLLRPRTAATAEDMATEPSAADPFSELLLQALYPPLRSAIMTAWNPLHPDPLLQFFDHWNTVLPPPVSRNLLHTMVLPRVRDCVHHWVSAPASAPPPHLWLHPWLPLMAAELQDLYPFVRKALVQLLSVWSPPEPSARDMLLPWKQVWSAAAWKDITARIVVPKLEAAMHHVLNLYPHQLNVAPCEWCSAWVELLPTRQLAGIYERGFFPKLHEVLHFWLVNSAQVNFSEVSQWLSEKKQMCIPPPLQDDPSVLHHLAAAAAAVADFEQHHALPPGYPAVRAFEDALAHRKTADDTAMQEHLQEVDRFSIKDFLEHKAEEAGLTYMPRHGRMVSGLQVYALGQLSVIVDLHAGVTKAFVVDRWVPMGVEEVVQLALNQGS